MDELLFIETIKVVDLIQRSKYLEMEEEGYLAKINEANLKNILDDYGGIIDEIVEIEYRKSFQYIKINNSDIYKTYVDFVIDGERSDLTLICDIYVCNNSIYKVIIDDVHVL